MFKDPDADPDYHTEPYPPTSAEFADAMLAHMTDNAKLTRTVLHN